MSKPSWSWTRTLTQVRSARPPSTTTHIAQDKFGNIWYLGSYTEIYEGGEFVNANDAWLADEKDAKPGVWMLTDPKKGMNYVQMQSSRETIRSEVDEVTTGNASV